MVAAFRRAVVIVCLLAGSLPAAGRITWKIEDRGQLKIEGHVPIAWNVYTVEKRKNLALILLGRRYLALDTKTRAVWEIDPKDLTAHGKDFESDEPETIGRRIPVDDWSERDVGPAERIIIKLGDYGATIEVELPHLIDLRRGIY
jgi:hypothetical protein